MMERFVHNFVTYKNPSPRIAISGIFTLISQEALDDSNQPECPNIGCVANRIVPKQLRLEQKTVANYTTAE